MSSIVIKGNTSGQIELAAPDVAGSTTLTLPTGTGTVITDTAPKAGNVLQVLQSTVSGTITTTSTSDVSSGLTQSITPSSASNKILLMVSGGKAYASSSNVVIVTAYRNGSSLGDAARSCPIEGAANGANHSLMYLDSPSSTSSVTYTIYYRSNNGGTAYFKDGNTYGTVKLTLMEIAG